MTAQRLLHLLVLMIMCCASSCNSQEVLVTVNVLVPVTTPRDAQLFITGNHPRVGDWNPGSVELYRQSDSLWTITLKLPREFFFEFKITRGVWNSQAIYHDTEIPPNIQISLTSDTVVTVRPINWTDILFTAAGGIVGTVKYHRRIVGDGLDYPRDIIVWLPPSYEKDSLIRYPVLYMHDGQNIIDPSTSFIGYDWHVDEVADSLIRERRLREVIVVGIYNSPDRMEEYAETKKGRAYMKFIVDKLKPMVDSTYRTFPDREHTAVMGSSLGGLISFFLVWNYQEVFSQAGCISPVFPDSLTRSIMEYPGMDKHIRIYMDNGGTGPERGLLPGCERMMRSLQHIGFTLHQNFEWFFDETGDHSERSWARRLWRPLTFFYGK